MPLEISRARSDPQPLLVCVRTSEKEGQSLCNNQGIGFFIPTSGCSRVQFLITRFVLQFVVALICHCSASVCYCKSA